MGVNRNALLGNDNTPLRSAVYIVTLAVSPGNNFKSLLGAAITTSYVTTLLSVVASSLTCVTVPSNTSSGNASTVNVTR